MDRSEITAAVAARLVAEQFPQWADEPIVPVAHGGWDNITFRLGEELSIRLPSGESSVAQVQKEQRWLPVLSPQLPLPIPEPVAVGVPGDEFPWPWSIYRWIEGEPAHTGLISDLSVFAADLARFLTALHGVESKDGPPAGPHNWFLGGSLTTWDQQVRESIDVLADDLDSHAVTDVWEAALASDTEQAWVHGDLRPSNLLVTNGALRAVIDFGCSAVGDPACDLLMAWTFFTGDSLEVFRSHLPYDEPTWARGRGWALWKPLIMLAGEKSNRDPNGVATRPFDWADLAREVVTRVLADHQRSS